MANDWDKRTYSIDTAEDKTIQAFIHHFEWFPAAANDDIVVKDNYGNILFECRATSGAPNLESFAIEKSEILNQWVQGVNVETIDGGTLLIYTK